MPTAAASQVGKIYQYVGTTGTYTKGYFYVCVQNEGQAEGVTATQTDTTGYDLGTISVDLDDYKTLASYSTTTFTWNYVGLPTSISTASYTFTRDSEQDGTGTYAWTSGSITIWTTSEKVKVGDKTYNTSTAETETAETVSAIVSRATTGTGYWVQGSNTAEVNPTTYGITMATQPVIGNIFTTLYHAATSTTYSWARINVQPSSTATVGRFLSSWNCATGLPTTDPEDNPYIYTTGDFYIVGNVGTGTNYRPNGSSYTRTASTTVETGNVQENDFYFYDGTSWLLLKNNAPTIATESWTFTTSTGTTVTKTVAAW